MSQFAALVADAQSAVSASEELRIGGGRLANTLTALEIARGLSEMADVTAPIDSPEGLEARLRILFTAARKAAELTGTVVDDSWVAKVEAEIMPPEVIAAIAYLMRRMQRSA